MTGEAPGRRYGLRKPTKQEAGEHRVEESGRVVIRRDGDAVERMFVTQHVYRERAIVDDDGLLEVIWKQLENRQFPIEQVKPRYALRKPFTYERELLGAKRGDMVIEKVEGDPPQTRSIIAPARVAKVIKDVDQDGLAAAWRELVAAGFIVDGEV